MRIRNAEPTDASKLSLLMNEGFGWENTKLFESSFFNNKNITCLIAENDQGEIMGSASLHLFEKMASSEQFTMFFSGSGLWCESALPIFY